LFESKLYTKPPVAINTLHIKTSACVKLSSR